MGRRCRERENCTPNPTMCKVIFHKCFAADPQPPNHPNQCLAQLQLCLLSSCCRLHMEPCGHVVVWISVNLWLVVCMCVADSPSPPSNTPSHQRTAYSYFYAVQITAIFHRGKSAHKMQQRFDCSCSCFWSGFSNPLPRPPPHFCCTLLSLLGAK